MALVEIVCISAIASLASRNNYIPSFLSCVGLRVRNRRVVEVDCVRVVILFMGLDVRRVGRNVVKSISSRLITLTP